MRIVNSRSYIVRDGSGNHFRRNRRFIATTQNQSPNDNELFFEEHIDRHNRPDRSVVRPPHFDRSNSDQQLPVRLELQDGGRSELQSPDTSLEVDPDSFYTASDSESPIDVDLTNSMSQSDSDDSSINVPYKTRSGRVVRPPIRFDI